jgi:hypothetical protein
VITSGNPYPRTSCVLLQGKSFSRLHITSSTRFVFEQLRTISHSKHFDVALDFHQLHHYLARCRQLERVRVLKKLPNRYGNIRIYIQRELEVLWLMVLQLFVMRNDIVLRSIVSLQNRHRILITYILHQDR